MLLDLSSPNLVSYEFKSADALQAALVEAGLPKLDVPGSVIINGRQITAKAWTHVQPTVYKLTIGPENYSLQVSIRRDQVEKLGILAANIARYGLGVPVSFEDVIEALIANAPLDNASRRPVYQDMYIWCADDEPGAFRVRHVSGDFEASLKKVSPTDIQPDDRVYVVVEHEIAYPYAAVDFVQIIGDTPLISTRRKHNIQPRQFCEAALVATPKLHLIG